MALAKVGFPRLGPGAPPYNGGLLFFGTDVPGANVKGQLKLRKRDDYVPLAILA